MKIRLSLLFFLSVWGVIADVASISVEKGESYRKQGKKSIISRTTVISIYRKKSHKEGTITRISTTVKNIYNRKTKESSTIVTTKKELLSHRGKKRKSKSK